SSPAPPAPPRRKRRRWRRWASASAGPPAARPCSSARSCGATDPAAAAPRRQPGGRSPWGGSPAARAPRGAPPPRLPARLPGGGIVTAPARPGARPRGRQGPPDERLGATRPLAVTGVIAACAVMVTGLVILTPLVLIGWIAAPHAGIG